MGKRYIHVGSWNIEHFSRKNDSRVDNVYALAEHMEMASLDVLALQELYVTGPRADGNGERGNSDLEKVLALIEEHTGEAWDYEVLQNRKAGDTTQLCAVAWNTAQLDKKETLKIDVSHKKGSLSLWDRAPHAVQFKFRGKTDFVLIPVHMKSNYGGAGRAIKVRHAEAETLVAQLPTVRDHFKDLDVVILGDTNCLDRHEGALKEFQNAGFEDLNAADASTFAGGKESPFDRILVPDNEREFLYSRQYIVQSANPADHDKFLSDHYLIKTVIKIRKDDD